MTAESFTKEVGGIIPGVAFTVSGDGKVLEFTNTNEGQIVFISNGAAVSNRKAKQVADALTDASGEYIYYAIV